MSIWLRPSIQCDMTDCESVLGGMHNESKRTLRWRARKTGWAWKESKQEDGNVKVLDVCPEHIGKDQNGE